MLLIKYYTSLVLVRHISYMDTYIVVSPTPITLFNRDSHLHIFQRRWLRFIKLSHSPKVIQMVSGRIRIRAQAMGSRTHTHHISL